MSPELKEFFQSWLNWVDAGAPEGEGFSRSKGLCYNLLDLLKGKEERTSVYDELMKLFQNRFGMESYHRKDGSPMWIYPFGGSWQYDVEYRDKTMHKNEERINWVHKMLEENGNEQLANG